MTNEEKILYDFIIDRYGDEKKELVFQIKEMEEIQGIDTKIARLLGNLKEGSYIQEFRLYGKDEIAVKLPEKKMENEDIGSTDIVLDTIHDMVMNKFIKRKFQRIDVNSKTFAEYSDLFKAFICVKNDDSEEQNVDNYFKFIANKVDESSSENYIKVLGPDGTGKSTFLSLLYLYLYDSYLKKELLEYPFYINLHYYDKNVIDAKSMDELNNVVKQHIQKDLKELIEFSTKTKTNFLIIIDGNDKYHRSHLKTSVILEDILNEIRGHKKIICLGEKTNIHRYRERDADSYIDDVTTYTFCFSPIYINEREKWSDVIEKFCYLFRKMKTIGKIENKINNCLDFFNIKEIDYNLLTIFCEVSQKTNLKDLVSISDLYHQYCLYNLNRDAAKLDISIELAYTYFMTKEFIPQNYISSNWSEWELIHQHKTISNYLLALHYSKLIFNGDVDGVRQFECVFTNGINIFLKSIINETDERQRKTIKFCGLMFDKGDYRVKAQAAYMVGRVKDSHLQHEAKKMLDAQKEKWNIKNISDDVERRRQYFFKRSILVSQLYIGEAAAGEEFLKNLFEIPVMNEVNRAFYLQYYDDVTSELERVNLYDPEKNKITYTAGVLFNYVNTRLLINSVKWSPEDCCHFQIHLFTLCSLIQPRLKNKQYAAEIEKLQSVITSALKCDRLEDNMKIYISMLKEDIEHRHFDIGHIYDELYKAKDIQRSGWIKKIKKGSIDVVRYENIIEHSYYCWLLGMLYLPEKRPKKEQYKGYEKNKILNYLLIHDLAETYTGDKLPEEKVTFHVQNENDCMLRIFMHDMYSNVANMDYYRKIWVKNDDINAKVARDIDIVQAIYQYCIYKKKHARFEEGRDDLWKKEKNKIQTSLGRKILDEVVLKKFGDIL